MSNPKLFDFISMYEQQLEVSGLPQIDYLISKSLPVKDLDYATIFKKTRLWYDNKTQKEINQT